VGGRSLTGGVASPCVPLVPTLWPNQIIPKLVTVAEISHVTFFKMTAVCHLGFFSPLGKVAGRAIYFTDVFSIFFF